MSVYRAQNNSVLSLGALLKTFAVLSLRTLWPFGSGPGIRLLGGTVTDAMEAAALTFNIHFIDIFVCSWGPRDDGAEMDGPNSLTEQALRLGTHKARLSSPSSNCCLSDGEQTSTLSVELSWEGQNVECWDYVDEFKYMPVYEITVHAKHSLTRPDNSSGYFLQTIDVDSFYMPVWDKIPFCLSFMNN